MRVWMIESTTPTEIKSTILSAGSVSEAVTAWKVATGEPVDLSITGITMIENATIA